MKASFKVIVLVAFVISSSTVTVVALANMATEVREDKIAVAFREGTCPEVCAINARGGSIFPAYAVIGSRRTVAGIWSADVMQWLLPLVVILVSLVLLIWNGRLLRQERARTGSIVESEELYRGLFERSKNAIVIVDAKTRKFKYANHGALQMLGYTQAEFCSLDVDDIHPAEALDEVHDEFEAQRKGAKTASYGLPLRRKGGSVIYACVCIGTVATSEGTFDFRIAADITEQKKAEEALQRSERFVQSILMSIQDHIAVLDRRGVILAVNKSWLDFARANDVSSIDLVSQGQNYLEICRRAVVESNDETAGSALEGISSVLNGQSNHFEMEYPCHTNLGECWFLMRVMPLVGSEDGVFIAHSDITERKQAEKALSQLRDELIHATRVGTLAEFTGALAHEINHPLGSILNNANAAKRFLDNDNPDMDEIREIIDDIICEDRRANEVIQKLRALMKKADSNYSRLNMNDIIEEVLSLTNSELVIENISLSKKLQENLPEVKGDRTQLQQVLLNLIINAADAMKTSKVKNLCVSTGKRDSQNIVVSVTDSGVGIDENKKDSLFKPFFTTKKHGLGMGLSVDKTIIKAHEGEIWAENNKEGGAAFFVSLPICKDKSP
jgi:PAS domain S-box-containing protein